MKKIFLLTAIAVATIFTFNSLIAQTYDFEDKLVPLSDLESNDHFSHYDGVSIDGDYAVVGGHNADGDATGSGIAFLYHWDDVSCYWEMVDIITAESAVGVPDPDPGSGFGWAVSIKDDYIIVGAPTYSVGSDIGGRVYIYELVADEAVFLQRIQATRNDLSDDSESGANFGRDLDWDGQQLVVGAPYETEDDALTSVAQAGAAYIYHLDGGTFSFIDKLFPQFRNAQDHFGWSVGIHGSFAVVGAHWEDEDEVDATTMTDAGSAYIYEFDELFGDWDFLQKIVAVDRSAGDWFGCSVDVYQQYVVVGARWDAENATGSDPKLFAGSAYVFEYNYLSSLYEIDQKIDASDREVGDSFGEEVKIYDQTILVGAYLNDVGVNGNAGQAYVFKKSGTWTEEQIFIAETPATNDNYSESIELDAKRIIIGSPQGDLDDADGVVVGKNNIGAAYIYDIEQRPVYDTILTDQVGNCAGEPITFKVYGTLNDAYDWEWFEDGCYGASLGEGPMVTLDIEESTTICVRAVGCYDYSVVEDCHCIEVDVNDDSWHQRTTDGIEETPSAVITDEEGNVYVTGVYKGYAEFNGGNNTDVTVDDDVPGSAYTTNPFISKYDNCGNLLWVSYGVGNTYNQFSNGITLYESGSELYIVGEFNSSITLMNGVGDEGIGSGSFTLTEAAGTIGGYVALLNRENGEVRFIEMVASNMSKSRLTEITINENNGDIYVAGQTYDLPSSEKIFIRKYHPIFTGLQPYQWEEKSYYMVGTRVIINGMDYDESSPEIDDMGSLWFTGEFKNSLRFAYSDPAITSGSASKDAFVGKFSEFDGGWGVEDYVTRELLVKGGIASDYSYHMVGNDIAVDPATGNVYITGTKVGLVSSAFGMAGEDLPLVSGNQVGFFVAMQYDGGIPTGALSEITNPVSTAYASGNGVTVKNDKVYFTGTRQRDVFFNSELPPALSQLDYVGIGGSHVYVVSYILSTGLYAWSNGTLNPSLISGSTHLPSAIAADDQGHAFIVGKFWNYMGYIDGAPSSGPVMTYSSNGGTLFTMRVDIEGVDDETLQSPVQDDLVSEDLESNGVHQSVDENKLGLDTKITSTINLRLFPNPTKDNTVLVIDNYILQQEYNVTIYSIDGKVIFTDMVINGRIDIDLNNYESGLYIVDVQSNDFNQRLTLVKTR